MRVEANSPKPDFASAMVPRVVLRQITPWPIRRALSKWLTRYRRQRRHERIKINKKSSSRTSAKRQQIPPRSLVEHTQTHDTPHLREVSTHGLLLDPGDLAYHESVDK